MGEVRGKHSDLMELLFMIPSKIKILLFEWHMYPAAECRMQCHLKGRFRPRQKKKVPFSHLDWCQVLSSRFKKKKKKTTLDYTCKSAATSIQDTHPSY